MTELTQEQLAEIRERTRAAYRRIHWSIQAPPSVTDREALLHHIDHQAARIAELRYRVKRALSGDLYALLTDIQNGIDALGHKDMANSAIQRIDALLTILEGDEA